MTRGGDSLDSPLFSYEGRGDSLDSLVLRTFYADRSSFDKEKRRGGKGNADFAVVMQSFVKASENEIGSNLVDCSSLYR